MGKQTALKLCALSINGANINGNCTEADLWQYFKYDGTKTGIVGKLMKLLQIS